MSVVFEAGELRPLDPREPERGEQPGIPDAKTKVLSRDPVLDGESPMLEFPSADRAIRG